MNEITVDSCLVQLSLSVMTSYGVAMKLIARWAPNLSYGTVWEPTRVGSSIMCRLSNVVQIAYKAFKQSCWLRPGG